jgi:hypothetical protein
LKAYELTEVRVIVGLNCRKFNESTLSFETEFLQI